MSMKKNNIEEMKFNIHPDCIKWLLKNYSDDDRQQLGINQDWNDNKPVLGKIIAISDKIKKPLAFFLLKPHTQSQVHSIHWDTRVVGSGSVLMNYKIQTEIERMIDIRESCIELSDILKIDNTKKFKNFDYTQSTISEIASYIRENITPQKQGIKTISDYIKKLMANIENVNILLFKTDTRLDKKLRGMAINYDVLPIISITSSGETFVGQVFSIYHELAHILINSSMLHNSNIYEHNNVETFCNNIASEVLLPSDLFTTDEFKDIIKKDNLALQDIQDICYKYYSSRETFVYRLFHLGHIKEEKMHELIQEIKENPIKKDDIKISSKGMKTIQNNAGANKISRKFCNVLMQSVRASVVHPYELYSFTGYGMNKSLDIIKYYDNSK